MPTMKSVQTAGPGKIEVAPLCARRPARPRRCSWPAAWPAPPPGRAGPARPHSDGFLPSPCDTSAIVLGGACALPLPRESRAYHRRQPPGTFPGSRVHAKIRRAMCRPA